MVSPFAALDPLKSVAPIPISFAWLKMNYLINGVQTEFYALYVPTPMGDLVLHFDRDGFADLIKKGAELQSGITIAHVMPPDLGGDINGNGQAG